LREELGKLEGALSGLREQIEVRIQELSRTRVDTVRESIEQSVVGLERERREAEEWRALLIHSQAELETLVAEDRDLCSDYRRRIQEVLSGGEDRVKSNLAALVSSLVVEETSIETALVGVNHPGLRSTVFVLAPPA
jgi:phage shock protein A